MCVQITLKLKAYCMKRKIIISNFLIIQTTKLLEINNLLFVRVGVYWQFYNIKIYREKFC